MTVRKSVRDPRRDQLAIDTIRTLAMDAVQRANSGHPGAPMGMAPMAYVLWTDFLRHAPTRPAWPDRDRFVLSAGHASMLLYALLHLTGYEVTLDDLRRFRQWGSHTPGHPESGLTPGVEATTGPLGQGFANGVGMAIAERRLAHEFNRPEHEIVDHWTYVICSDGDLQEGITAEAASLAGHLMLRRLVVLYDDNGVQLDGPTAASFSEDVLRRFEAYGWDTQRVEDGNDLIAIGSAVRQAHRDARPSIIAVRTHIAYGSPNRQDSFMAHGRPLGADEVRLTKEAYGWDPDLEFHVPDEALDVFRAAIPQGEALVTDWEERFARYQEDFPKEAAEFDRRLAGELPEGWRAVLLSYEAGEELATRGASQATINALGPVLPELFGGSADLSESTLTDIKGAPDFSADEAGRNLRFGVREHAMAGIANGIVYHGGFRPYVGTFLTFSDYMRGSVRLAALAGLRVIYVWSHDSVGLGEDGPTHQPVEHLAALRAMPNLWLVRPADANETVAAWALAVERRNGPVGIALSRQKVPVLPGTAERARAGVGHGGYILYDSAGPPGDGEGGPADPELILIGTGSEVQLAVGAAQALAAEGIHTRAVSLPCWELFERQPPSYREAVLPASVWRRVSVEAGVSFGWERWVGREGTMISLDHFGASAPGARVLAELGFGLDRVIDVARGVARGRFGTGRPEPARER